MTPGDPFLHKQHSKFNPRRILYTIRARLAERASRLHFGTFDIPLLELPTESPINIDYETSDTAVTPPQMQVLAKCIDVTEHTRGFAVEIGAYRGVTTSILASRTQRDYMAIDPYIGYGGAESDFIQMQQKIAHLPNVRHLRMTSGEAARQGHVEIASFVFVDAVHDYVNARFDGYTWGNKLSPGGLIAFHDTDSLIFAGVQRAVWELLNDPANHYSLFAHVEGLVVLKRETVSPHQSTGR